MPQRESRSTFRSHDDGGWLGLLDWFSGAAAQRMFRRPLVKGNRRPAIEEIRNLYGFLNYTASESVISGWIETLARNKQHKYGVHTYRIEDFDLTKSQIEERLGHYYDNFKDYI